MTGQPGDKASERHSPQFATTQWSQVLAAREDDANRAFEALSQLCETYWYPLYAYIRRRGNDVAEAEDLTQSFFERFLERDFIHDLTPGTGRFRSFLLAALQHFLANEWNRSQARKRGGGHAFLSLDDEDARRRYQLEPRDPTEPELLYDRRRALTMLDQVLAQLRAEFTAAEKAGTFDQFKGFLITNPPVGAYATTAAATGLSEGAVKVAVHRLRRRYGELLRAEVARTVADPTDVEPEVRHLIGVLGG